MRGKVGVLKGANYDYMGNALSDFVLASDHFYSGRFCFYKKLRVLETPFEEVMDCLVAEFLEVLDNSLRFEDDFRRLPSPQESI